MESLRRQGLGQLRDCPGLGKAPSSEKGKQLILQQGRGGLLPHHAPIEMRPLWEFSFRSSSDKRSSIYKEAQASQLIAVPLRDDLPVGSAF